MGAPRAAVAARHHRGPVPLGPRRVGVGEQLLLRRGAGGHQKLEGLRVRVDRRRQLHHRGQVARIAVADGDLGGHLRRQLVEHPRAASTRRCRDRRHAVPHDPALVHTGGRADRRRGRGADACRGADVPVQQPRRVTRTPADAGRVRDDARARGRPYRVARRRWRVRRVRVPRQGAPGVPRAPCLRARVPRLRPAEARTARRTALRARRRAARVGRMVDRAGAALACGRPSLHRRIAGQLVLERAVRLQRLWPAHRQRARQRRWSWGRWRTTGHRAVGPDRVDPVVQRRVRRPGVVVAPRRVDPHRRRARVHVEAAADGSHARRADPVGRDVVRDRRDLQPVEGDHPRVLHRRARARDRRADRYRRRDVLAATQRGMGAAGCSRASW